MSASSYPRQRLTLATPPAAEPVSLADLKAYLRIAHDDEDGVVAALGVAARHALEARAGLALLTQGWRVTLDRAPDEPLDLPIGPITHIDSIEIIDIAGAPETLSPSAYEATTGLSPRLRPVGPWPTPAPMIDGIRINVTAGWPDASAVPASLIQAVKLVTAHFYENREAAARTRVYSIPATADALIAPYKQVRL